MRLNLFFVLSGAGLLAYACGGSSDSVFLEDDKKDATTGSSSSSGEPPVIIPQSDAPLSDSPTDGTIVLSPQDAVIDVVDGVPIPTVQYTATIGGVATSVAWSIDRGELGSIGLTSGTFLPKGNLGGKARILASVGAKTIATNVTIRIKTAQNGSGGIADAGADASDAGGAGGRGGVGGDPEGGNVSAGVKLVLDSATIADTGLAWLYPYDGTVWPRGLLSPQLQWQQGAIGGYDALKITIKENNFEYTGYFAKNATTFKNHPIPQSVWKAMNQSNEGEEVTVTLTFAKADKAYGPITEKWKIASAPLKGTVYYNSYGTKLAQNFGGALPSGRFGGATLAIRGGSTDPSLIAGDNNDTTGCRVCHSVASDGSMLITQRGYGGQKLFSEYRLSTVAEAQMLPQPGNFAWSGIYPDGSMFFTDSSAMEGSVSTPSALYKMPTGAGPKTPILQTVTGLPSGLRAASPAFSPDGKAIAFNLYGGPANADTRTLAMMTFDKNTLSFGPVTVLHNPLNASHTALWPSFSPDSKFVVYQLETRYNGRDFGGTRGGPGCEAVNGCTDNNDTGTRAEIWSVDLATKTPIRLDKLNGVGTLPTGPFTHGNDATLNYEPTVNPVPSGGYAWVVFMSRRLYGNIATINPWQSDPRFTDISTKPTTKKLWVAAIDLNAPPGTDPSHPAFYLPAQELLAGNSRGFWVVDPCKADASSCETGDECCGGYCRQSGDGGGLVCSATVPTCAQEFEKCTTSADCCGTLLQCVNGRCAAPRPR